MSHLAPTGAWSFQRTGRRRTLGTEHGWRTQDHGPAGSTPRACRVVLSPDLRRNRNTEHGTRAPLDARRRLPLPPNSLQMSGAETGEQKRRRAVHRLTVLLLYL